MKIVTYLDNDSMNKPKIGDSEIFTVNEPVGPVMQEQLTRKYVNVFRDGVGRLKGEYHIRLDQHTDPV